MLDTIRVAIPLSQSQHTKALREIATHDRWHHAVHNPALGDMFVRAYLDCLPDNLDSYHREIHFSLSPNWNEEENNLVCEFSIPKSWYGHNIWLLYDFMPALLEIKERFNQLFNLNQNHKLIHPLDWKILRLDCCYAWKFPSQIKAQLFLDSLKHLDFPRKHPTIRPNSISFVGATYSFKFYLKYPEFITHDYKELIKSKVNQHWLEYLKASAEGVLRVEATYRTKYLRRKDIKIIADLFDWELDGNPLPIPLQLLKETMNRFTKGSLRMTTKNEVLGKVLAHYSTARAGALVAFWLFVQSFGMNKAREVYGKNTYYRNIRSLKSAGVSVIKIVEDSSDDEEENFNENFELVIPSPFAVNYIDNFRDSENIWNLCRN